jgi:ATP-dependent DNA helicase RecQ
MSLHGAEVELPIFRSWILNPHSLIEFQDPTNRRLSQVFSEVSSGRASSIELAVLLRQVICRWLELTGNGLLETRNFGNLLSKQDLERTGLSITCIGDVEIFQADEWRPEWLPSTLPDSLDRASLAGTEIGYRARFGETQSDPVFLSATGFDVYRSPGQKTAVRMAIEMEPGGVMIANLPTGSGKTEIVVAMAAQEGLIGIRKSVLLVVPTISLAQDLENRFRNQWGRKHKRDMSDVPFALTSETSEDDFIKIRERLLTGTQPIVVTSPESLVGRLRETVIEAGSNGRIGALVIDEAHLVTQWGRTFRPQFRILPQLQADLNSYQDGIRTLLLSATFTDEVLTDLSSQFRSKQGAHIVAANVIRAEPEYWIARTTDDGSRIDRVIESIDHLPRPLILYVTKPDDATRWYDKLREKGYSRLAKVTGEVGADDRRNALEGFGSNQKSIFDVVVATSAFGLGVDIEEVRSVVHACVPESIDRWYQEIGRGGRDRYVSTALLIPGSGDYSDARSLGITVLTNDLAYSRWLTMWESRRTIDGRNFVNLSSTPPGKQDGSYNRRWNSQILEVLAESGEIEKSHLSLYEASQVGLETGQTIGGLYEAWVEIGLPGRLPGIEFFGEPWTKAKLRYEASSIRALDAVDRMIKSGDVCSALSSAYYLDRTRWTGDVYSGFEITGRCGGCPRCRREKIETIQKPAPVPTIRWPRPDRVSRFDHFVRNHAFIDRRTLTEIDGVSVCEVGIASDPQISKLVEVCVKAGVRLGVGDQFQELREQFLYFDQSQDPENLLPIPSLIRHDIEFEKFLGYLRLRPRFSDGTSSPVLVLTSGLPEQLRYARPLSVVDVLGILGER